MVCPTGAPAPASANFEDCIRSAQAAAALGRPVAIVWVVAEDAQAAFAAADAAARALEWSL
jgi:hypothetical protein